jgi:predicted TIM-barrel fold metal-dependent hydrolase
MLIDCHNHVGVELLTYLRGEYPYAQSLTGLHADGTGQGVNRFVVFPCVSYLAADLKALREGRMLWPGGLEPVPYAFENARVLAEIYELFPEEGRATFPFLMLDPSRGTEAQAEALCRLHERYRIFGFKIQSTLIQSPITALLREGSVFLRLAAEWDLPILIHSSVLPEDCWAQAHAILDVVEQTPAVRFCLAHSCRFDRAALERVASLPNAWFDCSAHRIHCELAVRNHPAVAAPERRFPSDWRDPWRVLLDLAEAYPTKLMWGSDSPYYSFVCVVQGERFDLRSTYAQEVDCLRALPQKLQHQVAWENTLAFLGKNAGATL